MPVICSYDPATPFSRTNLIRSCLRGHFTTAAMQKSKVNHADTNCTRKALLTENVPTFQEESNEKDPKAKWLLQTKEKPPRLEKSHELHKTQV